VTALQQSVLVLVSARDTEGDKTDGANCNLQGTTRTMDFLKKTRTMDSCYLETGVTSASSLL